MEQVTKVEEEYSAAIIDLPSKGKVYSLDNPLASGQIKIKYLTAKEEDILTSQNLYEKGLVIDKLLESIVIGANKDDLIAGDKNAVLVAARIMAFGPEYKVSYTCQKCANIQEIDLDLGDLDPEELKISDDHTNGNRFKIKLNQSDATVEIGFLTHGDEQSIAKEIEFWSKQNKNSDQASRELTTRYKYIIKSVNGETSKTKIQQFISTKLTIQDSRQLRKFIKETAPDLDMTFPFECNSCGFADRASIPIGFNFFWPPEEL